MNEVLLSKTVVELLRTNSQSFSMIRSMIQSISNDHIKSAMNFVPDFGIVPKAVVPCRGTICPCKYRCSIISFTQQVCLLSYTLNKKKLRQILLLFNYGINHNKEFPSLYNDL